MRKRILLTGGAGFIGSNIAADLTEAGGYEIIIADAFGSAEKWRNLAKSDIAQIVEPADLPRFAQEEGRIDAIIHMGAISSTTETDVDLILRTNLTLSQTLWRAAAMRAIPFLYASSAATYGGGEHGFDDDAAPAALARLRPLNAYGWSKHLFDRWVAHQIGSGAMRPAQWAGLKFFNVYGPNEAHKGTMKSVIAQIFPKASAGETVTLFKSHNPHYADGGQKRDFVYVRDCAAVVRWLLETPKAEGLFNLGTGEARSFLDLARATFAALNRTPKIAFIDTPIEIRDKYQYFTQSRMDRLRAAGYAKPFTALEDGVADYVRGFLSSSDPYR